MDHGDLPIGRVLDSVLLETLNWIHERKRHDIAVDLRERLSESAGFEIVYTPQKEYHRAVELFEAHDGLTFGAATIAAHTELADIEYCYAFDDDFDRVSFITSLMMADNPFT